MNIQKLKPEHEVAYHELLALLSRHGDKVKAIEMLAMAANLVGKLIAFQDQRTVTPEMAMAIVIENLNAGNREVVATLATPIGNA